MADVELGYVRDRGDRDHIVEGEAMPRVRFNAVLHRERRRVGNPFQLRGALLALHMGVTAGVELDDWSAQTQRRIDLSLRRLDEQADADSGSRELLDEIGKVIVLPGGIETALGGALLAPLRDDARRMRSMPQRDLEHFLGCSHFQVQRQINLGHQPVDVAIRDVPPVLAQVRRDAVRAGLRGQDGRPHRVGMIAAARVPDRRYVVNVDAEAQLARHENADTNRQADEPKPDIMIRSRVEIGNSKAPTLRATIAPVSHRYRRSLLASHSPMKWSPTISPTAGHKRSSRA